MMDVTGKPALRWAGPGVTPDATALWSLPERWRTPLAYCLAVGANLVALQVLAWGFEDIGQPALIIFMVPIILCAGIAGLWPGLAATAVAALLSAYFLIPPIYSLEMAEALNSLRWVMMVVSGALVSALCEELHRARRRADASRRLQAVTLASIGDAVLVTDLDGRITFFNAESERLTGWMAAQALGQPLATVLRAVEEHTHLPVGDLVADALTSGQAVGAAGRAVLLARDGREIPIAHNAASIRQAQGSVSGAVLVFRDISDRQRAEEALRAKTAELEAIMAAVPAIIFIADDPECRQIRGNRTAQEFLRLPPQSNMSLTAPLNERPTRFRVLRDGVEIPRDQLPVQQAALGYEVHDFEEDVAFDDGTVRSLIGNATPLRGPDGDIRGAVAAFIDITARKTAEALLRTSQVQLRLLIEQAPVAIAMFDRSMNYLVTSDQWLEEFGQGFHNLVGRNHYEVVPDMPERWREIHQEALAGAMLRNDEDLWVHDDGSQVWLRWVVSPWTDEAGAIAGIIITSEDISARKRVEREVSRLNTELERRVAERTAELTAANQELDAFAYAVSHDLRAPLRALGGFSKALEEDFGEQLTGDARLYFDQIILASHRMSELIDGLLVLSRSTRAELDRSRVDVSDLAGRIRADLQRSEPGRQVVWDIEPGLVAWGDPRMIELVMRNLLDNAWKYTANTPQPEIRVLGGQEGDRCRCTVADNGAGFDPAFADKLFRPFQRLHRQEEFPGIGIGLATVQRIIHRHGGTMQAEGAVGQGARFGFVLPMPAPAESVS